MQTASQAALWPRIWRTVAVVSEFAEKVMGEKAIQAPLARIPVAPVAAHPLSIMIDSAASISRFTQNFMIFFELALLRLKTPLPAVSPGSQ